MTVDTLNEVDIFSTLSSDEVSRIYHLMENRSVPEGEVLFREGDPGNLMYIVLSGTVAITISVSEGEEVEVSRIGEGNFFGEMSIFEKDVRSATCRAVDECTLLSLGEEGLRTLMEKEPSTAIKVMIRMLNTATTRLQSTGGFLADMVKWGEDARIRAVTDDFTGLYNRRFFDDALNEAITESLKTAQPVSLAMVDFDRFGTLNKEYGEDVGDAVLLAAASIFREVFDESDILVRYGGDEFAFILPGKDGETALNRCQQVEDSLRKIDLLEGKKGSLKHVSASIGIAVCPAHGQKAGDLLGNADKALYAAKEAGRAQAALYGARRYKSKTRIPNRRSRNALFDAFIDAMFSRESFLITGHKNPDADCSAAIIAFSLILSKLSKKTTAVIGKEHKKKFSYLLDLCRGLPIQIVDAPEDVGENYDTVVVLDTPKPSMLEFGDEIRALMNREDIVVMEIDHHTESDGTFMGDEGYRLVDAVASTCGLIGQLAMRLSRKHIDGIFSQNFLMAIVTGIISDTQMGKFIRVRREKRHFKYFKKRLNQSLSKNTAGEHKNTSNISTALDIAQELEALTEEEEACFECFSRHKQTTGMISWIAFDEQKSNTLQEQFSMKTITEVARHTASILAEESGFLSLVAYYDDKAESDLIQLRMRRSHTYRELDLRTVLEHFKFENGGGHEGAVGFRLPRTQVADFNAFIERIVLGVIELAGQK